MMFVGRWYVMVTLYSCWKVQVTVVRLWVVDGKRVEGVFFIYEDACHVRRLRLQEKQVK
jgi:hypothetical protein